MSQIGPRWENISRIQGLFSDNSAMTLTWFKVTTYPLTKGNMWVKYELDWAKGVEDMLRTRDLGRTYRRMDRRTEERTDRLISVTRQQTGALSKWTYYTADEIWTYYVYQKQFRYIYKTKMPELTKFITYLAINSSFLHMW